MPEQPKQPIILENQKASAAVSKQDFEVGDIYVGSEDIVRIVDDIKAISEGEDILSIEKAEQTLELLQQLKKEEKKWIYSRDMQKMYDEMAVREGYLTDAEITKEIDDAYALLKEREAAGEKVREDKYTIVSSLAYINSDAAWEIRNMALPHHHMPRSLVGMENDSAWRVREGWMEDKETQWKALVSLAGMDNSKAWDMRGDTDRDAINIASAYSESLVGIDNSKSWKARKTLLLLGGSVLDQGVSIAGIDSDPAWQMRESMKLVVNCDEALATSLIGLDCERAWKMRDYLSEINAKPEIILRSLTGVDSDEAWTERKLLKDKVIPHHILSSIAGLSSREAREMRQSILEEKPEFYECSIIASLNGDHIAAAVRKMILRKRFEEMTKK